jgi:hypothetical protein
MRDRNGGYEAESFPVYAPRILAGIGTSILDATTLDRTFVIEMVRQTAAEKRERFRSRMVGPEAEQLKSEIIKWIKEHQQQIADLYMGGHFPYLKDFRDRTVDVIEPLAAILEVAYADSTDLGRARAELLEAVAHTRKDQPTFAEDHKILQALAELAQSEDPVVGNATELADRCSRPLGDKPENLDVSRVLRRYGYTIRSVRKGDEIRHRYIVPKSSLEDLLKRYGGADEVPPKTLT